MSYEAVEEDGKLYLDVELADNYFVMAAQLVDETGQIALSEGVQLAGDQPGEVSKLRFDLTFAQQVGFTMGRIYMLDYAYNEARSDMVSLELGGFRAEKRHSRPQPGHGRRGIYLGFGGHCTARGIPDGGTAAGDLVGER